MSKFTEEELAARAILRIARILYEQWEESPAGDQGDTRLLDRSMIDDRHTLVGRSIKGTEHREHVVPRAVIRDLCIEIFARGGSVEEAAATIRKHLKVALISKEEARHLDGTLGLKTKMPDGWDPKTGHVLARLAAAGIVLDTEQS